MLSQWGFNSKWNIFLLREFFFRKEKLPFWKRFDLQGSNKEVTKSCSLCTKKKKKKKKTRKSTHIVKHCKQPLLRDAAQLKDMNKM